MMYSEILKKPIINKHFQNRIQNEKDKLMEKSENYEFKNKTAECD